MKKFNEIPSWGTSVSFEQAANVSQFGDAYEQAAPQGINSKRLVAQVAFSRVKTDKANRVLEFVRLVGTVEPFLWTPPIPPWDSRVDHQAEAFNANTIVLVFRESFNPVVRLDLPAIGPNDGTPVSITVPAGAEVRFTLNGSNPTDTRGTIYAGPIPFATVAGKLLKAVAYTPGDGGYLDATVFKMSSPVVQRLFA
jgi:phage-related protein